MAGSGNDRSRFFDQTLANAKLAREEIDRVFEKAHQHNDALDSGALLQAGVNEAEGTGDSLPGLVDPQESGPCSTPTRRARWLAYRSRIAASTSPSITARAMQHS